MLYYLIWERIYPAVADLPVLGALSVFQYITVRTAMASTTALVISLLLGPALIKVLRDFQIGQNIRKEVPQSHQSKAGTPTMGGVLIVVSIVLSTLLWADLMNPFSWILVGSTLAFGAIGFADDYLKIIRKRSLGLRVKAKIGLQLFITLAIGSWLLYLAAQGVFSTRLTVAFSQDIYTGPRSNDLR